MDHPEATSHRRLHVAPSIHVSSDTSDASELEPTTSRGLRARRNLPNELQVDVNVYDIRHMDPNWSGSTMSKHSAISDTEITPDTHLLNKVPITASHLANIDSLSQGVLSRRDSLRRGMKYIDDTPRGISDTARSSYIPPHLEHMTRLPENSTLNVTRENAYDPLRRYSTSTLAAFSEASSARSSMERGEKIQEQLHKLVSAFHERARKVKEQVVIQPPSPTFSEEDNETPPERLTIPLNQMPVHPPSPSPTAHDTRGEGGSLRRMMSISTNASSSRPKLRFPGTFEPQSRLYITWLLTVSLAFMYNAYSIPMRAAFTFMQTDNNRHWWFLADYCCDILYLLDILFFKTSVRFVSNGVWIENRREIVKRYSHSWRFKLDLLASVPFDILYLIPNTGYSPLFRLPKLLKLPSYWEFQSRIDQVARSPHLLRVLNSLAYMLWMIHANGCLFYYISAIEGFGHNHWVYDGIRPAYLHCFWRSFIVATAVGNAPEPENIIENAYMIFSWLVGVFVFALLIGQIRDIFTQMTYQEDHYQKTVDTAIRYLQNLRLPKALQARVREWFSYNWEQHKTLDENSLLDGLPKKLKTDLVLCVHYNTLSKVQLFQGIDQSLIRDLVLKLKPVVFLPMDYVCKKGEVGKEMYIVRSGVLDVIAAENKVVATLREGSVFGEISLLALAGGNRRTADVRSRGFSNLYVLRKADLHEVLKDYPETKEALKKKAQRLYQRISPTDEKKLSPPVEVIKTRSPTPEFVRTVIHVLDPKSSLKKRLSKTSVRAPSFASIPPAPKEAATAESPDSEEDIGLPESNDDDKMERLPTPYPVPDVPKPESPRRPTSTELLRRRREQEVLQRNLSSDNEESPSIAPPKRRKPRSPFRTKESPRDKSPAPLAQVDSDDSTDAKSTLSFLPNFLAAPLRRLFQRPAKIAPVVSNDDVSQEIHELTATPAKSRKSRSKGQIFRLPSIPANHDSVGSRPPSIHSSTEDGNYDNLDAEPPDLEHSSDEYGDAGNDGKT